MKTKERVKSPEERAQETEYQRRRNLPGVEVRRMYTKRTADQVLSHTGRELGTRTEVTTRGKVTSVLYVLPALPEDLCRQSPSDASERERMGLRPTCPECGHANWTYLKGPSSWACQRHGWLADLGSKVS